MTTVLLATLLAATIQAATLELKVTAAGEPPAAPAAAQTVARVYVTNAAGDSIRLPGTVGYSRRNETHSVIDGMVRSDLPPGTYQIRAEKGHEYGIARQTVTLAEGTPTRIELSVPRLHDMNARGWYSGDMHTHRAPEEMTLLARAEDLNIAPDITRHVGDRRAAPPPFPTTHLVRIDPSHVVTLQNQEVERLVDGQNKGHGAVLLLNLPEPVDPLMNSLFPMDLAFCRRARELGAFVDAEKPIWKNTPVLVAMQAIDAIGIVNNHFHPNGMLLDAERYGSMERDKPEYQTIAGFAQWMMDLYYSFLNCGYRIPVSAGSASGVMPSWPGYERVYVKLEGPFRSEDWFRSLKAGRSIATNGPLLEVSVNNQPPGAEFAFEKTRMVRLKIDVRSQHALDRVEIVYNGAVVRTFAVSAEQFHTETEIKVPAAGWLAVRCFEPVTNTIRYAHTSPFYFVEKGRLPVKKADAERWARYIRSLAESVTAARYPDAAAYQTAQGVFTEAERVFRVRGASGK